MNSASPAAASTPTEQARLLAALMKPRCYPHAVNDIERVETHISTVLLTGTYAYKIKKPLDLGFLDFTTLALRRHCCEEELRLNRRLAPDLYLDVVAICGTAETPYLSPKESEGAIEYAVKMRQFDQQGLLDRMLSVGELAPQHVDALATIVADFHAHASRAHADDPWGCPATQEVLMRQNFDQIRALVSPSGQCGELDEIERWSIAQHARLATLMAQRLLDGFVRECHGDLHLGNIALVEGAIRVFDCIEFNADLRWTDVAAEIAFLVMDFAARGHADFGARFLNAYLTTTGDYASAILLPYYLTYRAMVRAKVACLRVHQPDLSADQRDVLTAEFATYLHLAHAFTQPRRRCLLITHGFSGSGKTTVTQPLLERLGALRLRSDVERKRLNGLSASARSASTLGAGLYAATATEATYTELLRLARLLLEVGWPVIVDATFLQKSWRDRFSALAQEMHLPFLLLNCQAAVAELRRRIEQRATTAADPSEATLAVLENQLETAEPLMVDEVKDVMMIDTGQDDGRRIVDAVLSRLQDGPDAWTINRSDSTSVPR